MRVPSVPPITWRENGAEQPIRGAGRNQRVHRRLLGCLRRHARRLPPRDGVTANWSRSRSRQNAGKRTRENRVALSVSIFYHRIMTFWQTAKRGEYMQPCSRRELALSTRTVAVLGH
jgi:hypothetical protein